MKDTKTRQFKDHLAAYLPQVIQAGRHTVLPRVAEVDDKMAGSLFWWVTLAVEEQAN